MKREPEKYTKIIFTHMASGNSISIFSLGPIDAQEVAQILANAHDKDWLYCRKTKLRGLSISIARQCTFYIEP